MEHINLLFFFCTLKCFNSQLLLWFVFCLFFSLFSLICVWLLRCLAEALSNRRKIYGLNEFVGDSELLHTNTNDAFTKYTQKIGQWLITKDIGRYSCLIFFSLDFINYLLFSDVFFFHLYGSLFVRNSIGNHMLCKKNINQPHTSTHRRKYSRNGLQLSIHGQTTA